MAKRIIYFKPTLIVILILKVTMEATQYVTKIGLVILIQHFLLLLKRRIFASYGLTGKRICCQRIVFLL